MANYIFLFMSFLFAFSSVNKIYNFNNFIYEISSYKIFMRYTILKYLALLVISLEVLVSFFFFVIPELASIVVIIMLLIFTGALIGKKKNNSSTSCGCFGKIELLSRFPITRNIVLIVLVIISIILDNSSEFVDEYIFFLVFIIVSLLYVFVDEILIYRRHYKK